MISSLLIQVFDPVVHDRSSFDCGVPELNDYLAKRARKEMSAGLAVCCVASLASQPQQVLGFYTLSAAVIVRTLLPDSLTRKLPRYREMPATLLGRLAVAKVAQRQGLGGRLLVSAMSRALQASEQVASWALVTDPKDQTAVEFYRKMGFSPLDDSRMFLPMTEIKMILSTR